MYFDTSLVCEKPVLSKDIYISPYFVSTSSAPLVISGTLLTAVNGVGGGINPRSCRLISSHPPTPGPILHVLPLIPHLVLTCISFFVMSGYINVYNETNIGMKVIMTHSIGWAADIMYLLPGENSQFGNLNQNWPYAWRWLKVVPMNPTDVTPEQRVRTSFLSARRSQPCLKYRQVHPRPPNCYIGSRKMDGDT